MAVMIVTLALASGFFQGASALANWWAEERPAQALDAVSFSFYLLAVCLAAGWAQSGFHFSVVLLLAVLAGAWLSDASERAAERLPAVGE